MCCSAPQRVVRFCLPSSDMCPSDICFCIHPSHLQDTPLHQVPMMGVVERTFVRGTLVFDKQNGGIVDRTRGPGKVCISSR